jgi:hypothetical protein
MGYFISPRANSTDAGQGFIADPTPAYWWKCNDAEGQSALANAGSSANGNMTISGTEGTDWNLQDSTILGRKPGLHLHQPSGSNTVMAEATVSLPAATSLTMMIGLRMSPGFVPTTGGIFALSDNTTNNYLGLILSTTLTGASIVAPGLFGEVKITTAANTQATQLALPRGELVALGLVWVHNTRIDVYVDGYLAATVAKVASMPTLTRARIGNTAFGSDSSRAGFIDARIYTSALTTTDMRTFSRNLRLI